MRTRHNTCPSLTSTAMLGRVHALRVPGTRLLMRPSGAGQHALTLLLHAPASATPVRMLCQPLHSLSKQPAPLQRNPRFTHASVKLTALRPRGSALAVYLNIKSPCRCFSSDEGGRGPPPKLTKRAQLTVLRTRVKVALRNLWTFYVTPNWRNRFFKGRVRGAFADKLIPLLIALCIAVYALWLACPPGNWKCALTMRRNFVWSWDNFKNFRVHTLITSMFSHQDIFHLGVNMIGLYFIGQALLPMLGVKTFLKVFLGGGIVSNVFHVANERMQGGHHGAMGASGGLMALFSTFTFMSPHSRFLLFFVVPVPAWVMLSGVVAYDTYSLLFSRSHTHSHAGHLGGVVWGRIMYSVIFRR